MPGLLSLSFLFSGHSERERKRKGIEFLSLFPFWPATLRTGQPLRGKGKRIDWWARASRCALRRAISQRYLCSHRLEAQKVKRINTSFLCAQSWDFFFSFSFVCQDWPSVTALRHANAWSWPHKRNKKKKRKAVAPAQWHCDRFADWRYRISSFNWPVLTAKRPQCCGDRPVFSFFLFPESHTEKKKCDSERKENKEN